MTSASDSIVFRHLFSTLESSAIWSDEKRTQYYLKFEGALATVQANLGIIPKEAGEIIPSKCHVELIDMNKLGEETKKIGYPVLPLVKQLVQCVNNTANGVGEWAHWGATTQDVTDTATVLQLQDTLLLVLSTLDKIIEILRELSLKYKSTPMAARSNLQQAVPMTFGFKLARLLATFQRHQQRLGEIMPRISVLEFGGAAGTLATLFDTGLALKVQEELASKLGLTPPEIAWHTERDRIAEVGAFFALITGTCAKFAFDVKLLMQTEVGEVSEPFAPHRGSSSTMPQKRNPISSAYITSIASMVKQLSAALFDAMVEDHERSTALSHTLEILGGLEVNPEAMKKNLELTNGSIVSEAVMMEFGKKMGRQVAHDLVYDICRKAAEDTTVPFADLLFQNETVRQYGYGRDYLGRLCDPANYLGLSEEMVIRVVNMSSQV